MAEFVKVMLLDDYGETNESNRTFFVIASDEVFLTCHEWAFVYSNYLYCGIGVLGFLLNIMCIITLSNSTFYKNNSNGAVFKFLLIKCYFDAGILFLKAIGPLFTCVEWPLRSHYAVNVFDLVANKYFIFVCTLCSIVFELAAQLNRLVAISRCLNKLMLNRLLLLLRDFSYKGVTTVLTFLISLFYVFKLFEYKIHESVSSSSEMENASTTTRYSLYMAEFASTPLFHRLELTHSFIRDFCCVLALLVLDIWVLLVFKQAMRNKRRLMSRLMSADNEPMQRIQSLEHNTTLMILVIGFMTFVCRLPIFVNYLPLRSFNSKLCLQLFTESLFFVNISSSFFFYFIFNETFRNLFGQFFLAKRRPVSTRYSPTTATLRHNRGMLTESIKLREIEEMKAQLSA